MRHRREPLPEGHSLGIVIDTMRSWLDGEPVWPYAKILDVWGKQFRSRSYMFEDAEFAIERTLDMFRLRDDWVRQFGFAVPCGELMDELARSKMVIEIGAGSGFMTRLMRNHHINVVGTDSGHDGYAFRRATHDLMQIQLPGKTAIRRFREADTVFCSWPSYDSTWFRQALKAMQVGQRMIVVREDATGEETAWEYFDACFEPVNTIDIPAFQHLNDYVDVRIKKRPRNK